MKIEQALKEAGSVPRGFHSRQGRKLQRGIKREFSRGNDVRGQKFKPLSLDYRRRKLKGIASPNQQNISGKPDMFLSGDLLRSGYFNRINFKNKNTWQMTTGASRAGTTALEHSGKIARPKGLPIRAIIGDAQEDDVVHPKVKKEFIKAYSKRIFGHFKKVPKKEFL